MKKLFLLVTMLFTLTTLASSSPLNYFDNETECLILEDATYAGYIIGQSVKSQSVRDVLRCLGNGDASHYDDSVYFSYPQHGISIRIESRLKKVTSVFFYSGVSDTDLGASNVGSYVGTLPNDIMFNDSQSMLWSLIGLPYKDYKVKVSHRTVVYSESYELPEHGLNMYVKYANVYNNSVLRKKIAYIGLTK